MMPTPPFLPSAVTERIAGTAGDPRVRRVAPFAALAIAALLAAIVPGPVARLAREVIAQPVTPSTAAESPAAGSSAAPSPPEPGGGAGPGAPRPGAGGPPVDDGVATGSPAGTGIPPAPTPPDPAGPDPITLPIPEGLAAFVAIASPLGTPVCGAAGVAGFAVDAILKSNDIPLDISPATAFVYLACGAVPLPPERTICPVDNPILAAIAEASGGLVPVPAPMGAAVDTLRAVERLLTSLTGSPPSDDLTDRLAQALNCEVGGSP